MATPVLTLATLTEYQTVLIDGTAYVLLPPDALPALDYRRLESLSTRLEVLWTKGEACTPEEVTELKGVLHSLCQLMLQAPADVHLRLTDLQRFRIYQAFLALPRPGLLPLAATTAKPKTGANSRRGSNGSTAAPILRPGTRRSRAPSSGRSSR